MKKAKPEIRNPKEARNPKSEWAGGRAGSSGGSAFWASGGEPADESLVLKEGGQTPPPPPQELLERTARLAEAIVRFAKAVPHGLVTNRLIDQLVGAGSSIAANYCEADDSASGRDFRKSIGTCRKESKETMLFIRLVATAREDFAPEARKLWREAKELNLIFGSIWRKGR